jgi:hypothetical protein
MLQAPYFLSFIKVITGDHHEQDSASQTRFNIGQGFGLSDVVCVLYCPPTKPFEWHFARGPLNWFWD